MPVNAHKIMQEESSILGLAEVGSGRISVYGDSNCLDSSHMVTNCYWLLKKILDFTSANIKDPVLFSNPVRRNQPLLKDDNQLPSRRTDVNFSTYSGVLGKNLICQSDSRFEIWGTHGYSSQTIGKNRRLPGFPAAEFERNLNMTLGGSIAEQANITNSSISSSSKLGNKSSKTIDLLGLLNRDEVRRLPFSCSCFSFYFCFSHHFPVIHST